LVVGINPVSSPLNSNNGKLIRKIGKVCLRGVLSEIFIDETTGKRVVTKKFVTKNMLNENYVFVSIEASSDALYIQTRRCV